VIDTGRLEHRVAIQTVTRTANVMNEPEEAWATDGERWALVEGQTGREVQRANQTAPTATHKVTMRADSLTKALTTDKRLVWRGPAGNVTLGIVYVDLSLTRQGVVSCLCEAAA
jgi:head-tail adaptor